MSGTDSTKDAMIVGPSPAIILVRPQMGENIGAAARAMKNFGLNQMRIVDPRDGWPNEKAHAMSSRADDILDAATLYDDAPAAVADLHAVYATTARAREMEKPCLTPRQAVGDMRARLERGEKIGILFGGEKAGLDNDDATLAQNIIQIHANPAFSSINLGQAVLLVAYEWFTSGPVPEVVVAGDSLPATLDEVAYFENRLEAELLDKGFLKPPEKRPSMMRNLRNIFRRADLTGQEIRSLHGVISALIRREGDADD
jgi:tRNA/rRNA methyltransferase